MSTNTDGGKGVKGQNKKSYWFKKISEEEKKVDKYRKEGGNRSFFDDQRISNCKKCEGKGQTWRRNKE